MKKKRSVNPISLKNLTHEGRPLAVGEVKKKRYLTVSETGWAGTQEVAQSLGLTGVSELLEQIGRGTVVACKLEES